MSFLDDIKSLIVAAGVPAASVLLSSKAVLPTTGGPYLSIIETGGSEPLRTHNATIDAYQYPSAQLLARGTDYKLTRAMLQTAYNGVAGVQNQTVNGVWYASIRPRQGLTDLSLDEAGRARVAFNVLAIKRPS